MARSRPPTEAQQLVEIIARIIDTRRLASRISPSWVATEAMTELDPKRTSKPLVYLGCHLELRQIARGLLRSWFEDADPDEHQHELWPDLQWRYPTARSSGGDEPEYVKLEEMSDNDIDYNVTRLRNEARSKLAHADALEAYGRRRHAA